MPQIIAADYLSEAEDEYGRTADGIKYRLDELTSLEARLAPFFTSGHEAALGDNIPALKFEME